MAKKVRTPAPPRRPVQAPKKRGGKRPRPGPVAPSDRRNLWVIIGVLVAIAAAAVAAALFFALRGKNTSSHAATTTTSAGFQMQVNAVQDAAQNNLPGVRRTKAPWPPGFAHLDSRLALLDLNGAPSERLAYHIHQHLNLFLNGKPLTVPPYIGFCCPPQFSYLTQLHTHSADGVVHVESATPHQYKLGDFFAEWGVFLNKQCVGAYCQGYKWYVNGKPMTGNPQDLVLKRYLEIVIAIGKQPTHIPSTYNWQGL